MKKVIKLMLGVGLLLGLSGCGIHLNTPALIQNSPDVIFRENNFRVLRMVETSTTSTYVLGFGGVSRDEIRKNAVAELIKKAHLNGSQTVINITERTSVSGIPPIYVQYTITTAGTVVEFTNNVNINIKTSQVKEEDASYIPEIAPSPVLPSLVPSGHSSTQATPPPMVLR